MPAEEFPSLLARQEQRVNNPMAKAGGVFTKADPDLAHVPIIGVTALTMEYDRERCLAAGMVDYISKPLSLKKLVQVIEQHLTGAEKPGRWGCCIRFHNPWTDIRRRILAEWPAVSRKFVID